jgi:hypothetical protein
MMTRHRQHGMTFIGYLLLFGLLGMVVMVGLRLLPAYMEYFKVSSTLESVAEESNVETTTAQLRQAIAARFQVNGVNTINSRDIAIARSSGVLTLTAAYEYRTPMMGNVDAVVVFEKVVEGGGN